MARLGSQRRVLVDVNQVPVYVRDAVLAAVDPTYFEDSSTVISRQYARAASGLPSPCTSPSLAFQRCRVRRSMPAIAQAKCSRAPLPCAM